MRAGALCTRNQCGAVIPGLRWREKGRGDRSRSTDLEFQENSDLMELLQEDEPRLIHGAQVQGGTKGDEIS